MGWHQGKTWGRVGGEERGERKANFTSQVAAAGGELEQLPAPAPAAFWARDRCPAFVLYGPSPAGGSDYHGDGAWVATVTREPLEEKAAAAGGREVDKGFTRREDPGL